MRPKSGLQKTFRYLLSLGAVLVVSLSYSDVEYTDDELDAMLFGEELPSEGKSSPWELLGEVSVGLGHSENPLLREGGQEDAYFLYTELQAIASRPLPNRSAQWTNILWLENRQFEGLDELDRETFLFAQSRYIFNTEVGSLYGSLDFLHIRQAFDASLDDFEVSTELVEANRPVAKFGWTRDWSRLSADLSAGFGKMSFVEPEDDYRVSIFESTVDWQLTDTAGFELQYQKTRKAYDSKLTRDAFGFSQPGTLLEIDSDETELSWYRKIDYGKLEIRPEMGISYESFTDNGAGYFNRDRLRYKASLDFRRDTWKGEVGLRIGDQEYESRLATLDELREDKAVVWNLNVEKRLWNEWTGLLSVEFASDQSNEELSSFDSSSIMLGLRLPGFAK